MGKIVKLMKSHSLEVVVNYFEVLRRLKYKSIDIGIYDVSRYIWYALSKSRVYSIMSNKDYCDKYDSSSCTIKSNRIGTCIRVCSYGGNTNPQEYNAQLPDLVLYTHNNVCVISGSDHIISNKKGVLINDFCSENDKDYNKIYIDKQTYLVKGRTAIVKSKPERRSIKSGIMMNGKFPFNYYHIILENLIRLIALEDINNKIPQDVPYIIDEEIESIPSFHRIFEILTNDMKREIIIVNGNEELYVEQLYCITPINILVPKYKDDEKGKDTDFLFDKEYIMRLRNKLLNEKSSNHYPKRIFLTRQLSTHRQFNEDEIFEILKSKGFVKVAPERYRFEDQMALFAGAECVVGGSGAAFTNLLFSSKPCLAICFFKNLNFLAPVFSTPLGYAGVDFMCFLSKEKGSGREPHTKNYNINKDDFNSYCNDTLFPLLEKWDNLSIS